jgi:hypothetical protein
LLAAVSSLAGGPVGGPNICPSPDALWHELESLLTREDLRTRLPASADAPSIRIDDLGPSFQVSVLGKEREYRDEGRDCARRARIGALFAALVIDPSALFRAEPSTQQTVSSADRLPVPKTTPPPISVPASEPTHPWKTNGRLEGAAAMMGGLDGPVWAPAWGGVVRVSAGGRTLGLVLGVVASWAADTAMGGVRLRQWRMPVDLGVRWTSTAGRFSWYGEIGLVTAVLRERALDLSTSKSGMAVEVGGRLTGGARWASSATVSPFLAVSVDVIPDPPTIAALPAGTVGRTSYGWLLASVGVSWGFR